MPKLQELEEEEALAETLHKKLFNVMSLVGMKHAALIIDEGQGGKDTDYAIFIQGSKFRMEISRNPRGRKPYWSILSFKDAVCDVRFAAERGDINLTYHVEEAYASAQVGLLLKTQDDLAIKVAQELAKVREHPSGRKVDIKNLSLLRQEWDGNVYTFLAYHLRG